MAAIASTARMPVAVIGAGAVGRMHADRLLRHAGTQLAAIADPTPAGRDFAQGLGVPWFADHRDLLAAVQPPAAVVATPNATHAAVGIDCLRAGAATLVEKPVADDVDSARQLCDVAQATGVPLLVGHQRRHNVALQRARALITGGAIGRPVAASVMATWLKPDAYFDLAWRRSAGGGPVLINLIHDIDMVRFLLGEVAAVQAVASNAVRGFEVEDTAAAVLTMRSGALVTLLVSDVTAAPWNWDLSAGEAAHYPQQPVDAHFLCGTQGSLTLPHLRLWRYAGEAGWQQPLTMEHTPGYRCDPYERQLQHLRDVAEGRAEPLCSGPDALHTLQATQALLQAAREGRRVALAANDEKEKTPCPA